MPQQLGYFLSGLLCRDTRIYPQLVLLSRIGVTQAVIGQIGTFIYLQVRRSMTDEHALPTVSACKMNAAPHDTVPFP